MEQYAVCIENINLKYKFVKNLSFKQEIIKYIKLKKDNSRIREVCALKDISFNVKKGSTVGIIGMNGSGKTTLLKTIAGIFKPDSGYLRTFGGSVSLLTLGAGFNNELSGIENIYLNGLLMGLKRQDIDEKLDEIINFADIGEFIHYPVKTYSTGMRTRLAFSIACNIEPEILLIDEVLGVGDEAFKKVSEKKIKELINDSRTVFIVSHSLSAISQLCTETAWLHEGKLMQFGKTADVINAYKDFVSEIKRG